jgi:hypothetical protein
MIVWRDRAGAAGNEARLEAKVDAVAYIPQVVHFPESAAI